MLISSNCKMILCWPISNPYCYKLFLLIYFKSKRLSLAALPPVVEFVLLLLLLLLDVPLVLLLLELVLLELLLELLVPPPLHFRMKLTEASSAFLQTPYAAKHAFFRLFISDCAVFAEQLSFLSFADSTAAAALFQHSHTSVPFALFFMVMVKHFAFVFCTPS